MSAYIPILLWLISAGICYYIAKRRNVKITLFKRLIIVILGPLAIPLVFFAKTEKAIQSR
ncbi:hypothetical protein MNBD_GAMMA18-903 [hydrothermal vent metagenome]|uniref:Uncharacterized protein n=1 Tax=hydrothermal vent metagenome TaxID=652676 RepID=A0A3B0YXJ7_9ZZZZ